MHDSSNESLVERFPPVPLHSAFLFTSDWISSLPISLAHIDAARVLPWYLPYLLTKPGPNAAEQSENNTMSKRLIYSFN